MNTAIAVLAAGGSSRLGTPKQLLSFDGRSLLRIAAEAACASIADDVVVVVGAEASQMHDQLMGLRVRMVENDRWRNGLSSSIHCAVRALAPACDALLLMACDQRAVTTAHLDRLLHAAGAANGAPAASGYAGTHGIPAVFHRAQFSELLRLSGDAGAKIVLAARGNALTIVPLPAGERDIDTQSDTRPVF